MARYRFTSESVTEGHPDKLCDAVSDSILDAIIKHTHDMGVIQAGDRPVGREPLRRHARFFWFRLRR